MKIDEGFQITADHRIRDLIEPGPGLVQPVGINQLDDGVSPGGVFLGLRRARPAGELYVEIIVCHDAAILPGQERAVKEN